MSFSRSKQVVYRTLLILAIVLLSSGNLAASAQSGETAANPPAAESPSVPSLLPRRAFLPLISNGPKLSTRLGYGVIHPLSWYPELNSLAAGWYVDWYVNTAAPRPQGIEYVPMVRVHQALVDKAGCERSGPDAHDRNLCPYAVPWSYEVSPSFTQLRAAVLANRGALWLIGNEIDRRDWPGGGQDEILPELYAVAYHDIYYLIKQADPTARVANGGLLQPSPLRLQYMSKIWDYYKAAYGEVMPVDVWNVHNFILREQANDYGADIPPGNPARYGVLYASDWSHVDLEIFKQQIRAFRQWMKDRGQQNKPLIVSEYGVLYRHDGLENPDVVSNFMLGTFDFFLNGRDCTLGSPNDGCRLVQRWAWYSLDDTYVSRFNRYGALFDELTRQITGNGVKFRQFSLANLDALNR